LQRGADGVGANPLDPDRFEGRRVSCDHDHVAPANREELGQEGGERRVGLPFFRRRSHGDTGSTLPFTQTSRPGSPRHDLDGQQDGLPHKRQLEHVDILQNLE
jgi:hypothetical protein